MQTFIGAIRMFGGIYAPKTFGFASGGLISVSSNPALFSLFGTMYGGDGRTSFGMPDLRGRAPINRNLSSPAGAPVYVQGGMLGTETVSLGVAEMPLHSHRWQASRNEPGYSSPADKVLSSEEYYTTDEAAEDPQPLYAESIGSTGQGAPHNNMMPFLAINFIVALQGAYPQRN